MKLIGGAYVSGMSVFWSAKRSKMVGLVVRRDAREKFARLVAKEDALVPGFIVPHSGHIPGILRWRSKAQVINSVISGVCIPMINEALRQYALNVKPSQTRGEIVNAVNSDASPTLANSAGDLTDHYPTIWLYLPAEQAGLWLITEQSLQLLLGDVLPFHCPVSRWQFQV
jgi:hypothetical protein